jgi:hypothetical protein
MIPVALSPKARALIDAHRHARRPTTADRERVAAALRAQLGTRALPLETPTRSWSASNGQLLSATAFGMCVVGSVLFFARKPGTTSGPAAQSPNRAVLTAQSATAASARSEPAPLGPIEAAAAPTSKLTASAPRRVPARPLASPASDALAEEVLLLSRATTQLSSGQAGRALATLEEHQRRFSTGALRDERNAAKARALCKLRRFGEGGDSLALLARGTPLAARAKEDCDSASSGADKSHSPRKAESD